MNWKKMSCPGKNVKVVVLGDIGRSPRMQYHSLSLADAGYNVDIIGYGETDPMNSIKLNPSILYHYLLPLPVIPLRLLNYIFKTVLLTINLLFLLFITTKSDFVLVQNPPAIPALIVCWIYCKIIGAKFIIDWHNYAHTIMALTVGKGNPLVSVTRKLETFAGSKADYNFCVTKAMKEDLRRNNNIAAVTLYDRPPLMFQSISLEQKAKFLDKFTQKYMNSVDNREDFIFVEQIDNILSLKNVRPGILVSSTSWTEDEDFSILLHALKDYEKHIQEGNHRNLPKLLCVISGKGPLKQFYQNQINKNKWNSVKLVTPWLESEDYPLMLASADLGVSLHTSSSGLDLPMKIVDMFGCGLPVCAYDFQCLNELVEHDKNSFVFKSSQELSKLILDWYENFPKNQMRNELEKKFKTELESFQNLRWRKNWEKIAAPLFQ